MVLSPSERSLRGKIGAFSLHSKHDPRETTKPGRAAFLQRFLDGIPADLPEAERFRRAQAALNAYMATLALRSAKTRRRRAERQGGGS
jgi:hypothetical protein